MKKLVVAVLKIAVSVGLLAYLVVQAQRNSVFEDLAARPKQWGLLVGALAVCFAAVLLTFVRWYFLVRALGLPLTWRDALRISFLGYLFNLAPMGIVGGDLLKAVLLARHQGRSAESFATVFVDRVIGLYVLFIVAAAAILATGLNQSPSTEIRLVCNATFLLTALGTVAVVVPLLPDVPGLSGSAWAARVPYIGSDLQKLLEAVRLYRLHLGVLAWSSLATIAVHTLFAIGIYLIAGGLYEQIHPLGTQLVVMPLSCATGVLPVTIGPFEVVLDRLYATIPLPDGDHMAAGQGLVVALAYRILTVLIAAVGLLYYLGSRKEVAEVMHAAQPEVESPPAESASSESLPGQGPAQPAALEGSPRSRALP